MRSHPSGVQHSLVPPSVKQINAYLCIFCLFCLTTDFRRTYPVVSYPSHSSQHHLMDFHNIKGNNKMTQITSNTQQGKTGKRL